MVNAVRTEEKSGQVSAIIIMQFFCLKEIQDTVQVLAKLLNNLNSLRAACINTCNSV